MHFKAVAGLVLLTFANQASASCAYGTILQPRAEGGTVKVNTFGYAGEKVNHGAHSPIIPRHLLIPPVRHSVRLTEVLQGPARWINLDPTKNALCTYGTKQSPIDMTAGSFTVVPGRNLSLSIADRAPGTEFENLGTTVEVVAKGGNMTFGNVQYTLQQFHFHLPSEHLDNGTSMAMEMHMVWQGPAGQIAVIGSFIDVNDAAGTKNTAILEDVLGSVEKIARPGTKTKTGALKMSELVNVLSAGSFQT